MKDKIIMLIIGALIGAIITAGCFLIFKNNSAQTQGEQRRNGQSMGNFTPGEMPSGERGSKENQNSNSTGTTTTSTSNSTASSTSATSND